MKKRITESQLSNIIAESVKKILNEDENIWADYFYKEKEDKSKELSDRILSLRAKAIMLYDFIEKGNGIWGYRVADSKELQRERLTMAANVVKAINNLFKAVNETEYREAEGWQKFGI